MRDATGTVTSEPLVPADDPTTLIATVPKALLAVGPVAYWGEFTAKGYADSYRWPMPGDSHADLREFTNPTEVDLDMAAVSAPVNKGTVAYRAVWGAGLDNLGLDRDDTFGPTSFDVGQDGSVYVADLINGRILRTSPDGASSAFPLKQGDFPDIAVNEDVVSVLYPNGRGTGSPFIEQIAMTGEITDTIPVLDPRPRNVRNVGRSISVNDAQSGIRSLVMSGSQAVAEDDQATAYEAIASTAPEVLVKHVDDHTIRISRIDGDKITNWELTSKGLLGPIALANPTDNGVFVMQSEFSENSSRYLALALSGSGVTQTTVLPDRRYVELTAGSEFRLANGQLWAAGSDEVGFDIRSYSLKELGVSR